MKICFNSCHPSNDWGILLYFIYSLVILEANLGDISCFCLLSTKSFIFSSFFIVSSFFSSFGVIIFSIVFNSEVISLGTDISFLFGSLTLISSFLFSFFDSFSSISVILLALSIFSFFKSSLFWLSFFSSIIVWDVIVDDGTSVFLLPISFLLIIFDVIVGVISVLLSIISVL